MLVENSAGLKQSRTLPMISCKHSDWYAQPVPAGNKCLTGTVVSYEA